MDVGSWMEGIVASYGYLGVFFISFIGNATIFFPLPASLIVYALGATFNPFLLGISAGLGAALGEGVGYGIGYGVEKTVNIRDSKFGRQYKLAESLFKRYGFLAIVLFAATPLPDDIVGLVCGAVKYPFFAFLFACSIGKTLMHWVLAYGGLYSLEFVKNIFEVHGAIVGWVIIILGIGALFILTKKVGLEELIEKLERKEQ